MYDRILYIVRAIVSIRMSVGPGRTRQQTFLIFFMCYRKKKKLKKKRNAVGKFKKKLFLLIISIGPGMLDCSQMVFQDLNVFDS